METHMTEITERVALTRRVSLAEFGEDDDWKDCYAIVILVDFDQATAVSQIETATMTNIQATEHMFEICKPNFVGGKIRVISSDGTYKLIDMKADHMKSW